jgi:hypothetical protein
METLKTVLRSFLRGPIYIVVFGLIFFGIGAGLSYKQYVVARDGGEAVGEVVGLSQDCDDDGCSYSPNVRFEIPGGRTISFESTYSSSPPAYEIGEQVEVIYPLDAPQDAEIKGAGRVFRIVFMAVGGLVMLGGFGFYGSLIKENLAQAQSNLS